ncbi:uncharacterized protein LOC141655753 [Silene latifolia]|uniref:uncharacterized protein LOC141655753 n=1 Tax=Silene latifolia TaxID=37657 RepID=UPI003D77AA37
MSIPPNSPWRGCAAYYPQPLSDADEGGAQFLTESIYMFNCRVLNPPLPDIEYRDSTNDQDITHHVFRWDKADYEHVFREGFETRRQQNTPDDIFYNLDHYVHHGGRPLGDTRRPANYAFVSTTLDSGWHPSIKHETGAQRTVVDVWRYEIYAPGGIWVADTLRERYKYPGQDEVCFVAGIARQYIRSAQRFKLIATANSRFTRKERADNKLILNENFNPQSHPERLITILRPIADYVDENSKRAHLVLKFFKPNDNLDSTSTDQQRRRRSTSSTSSLDWYATEVTNAETYIDAAFRTSRASEVCLFMKNEYVLLKYTPGSTKGERILKGPQFIREAFTSLKGTAFAEYGIYCSFGSHDVNEAFIFSGILAAKINYANDKIINGPMKLTKMFPFLKKTVFEVGIQAGFESSNKYEAFIFKGNQCGVINYGSTSPKLIGGIRRISDAFPGLRKTIFEDGIDAGFTSHLKNEAYLFKGDSFALINLASGGSIIGGIKKIVTEWSSLRPVLPCHNVSY